MKVLKIQKKKKKRERKEKADYIAVLKFDSKYE